MTKRLNTQQPIQQQMNYLPLEEDSRPRFKTKYDPSEDEGIDFPEESLTQQQFKEDSDINNIIANMGRGIMPIGQDPALARYGDFSEPIEYQEALNTVRNANETFQKLPAHVRERFGNNPQAFLEFATNPENIEDMVKWGLATEREAEKVREVLVERVKEEAPEPAPVERKTQRRT